MQRVAIWASLAAPLRYFVEAYIHSRASRCRSANFLEHLKELYVNLSWLLFVLFLATPFFNVFLPPSLIVSLSFNSWSHKSHTP